MPDLPPVELRRTIERLHDDKWTPVDFLSLKAGDVTRWFEPTGEPVPLPYGNHLRILSEPYPAEGVWTVDIEPAFLPEDETIEISFA